MASVAELKHEACTAIDKLSDELHGVSKAIFDKPELAFEEKNAHDVLCNFLEKHGFPVERNYKLDTAFRAGYGSTDSGLPHVAVISEYDALPQIGHACGHNLIAEVGVGAGVGIKAALQLAADKGKTLGKVSVLGSPAEEGGGGGKVDLIEQHAFSDISLAMMTHPFRLTNSRPIKFAMEVLNITFKGKASHAAGAPWAGLNALDAAVMAYNNVSCLRQQMKPDWRVHGVITNGGAKPNIIPEETAMEYYIRAPTMGELEILKAKMTNCFTAAATATGCEVELTWQPRPYENMITNETIASLYDANANELGIEFERDPQMIKLATGSTDMGNVSHVVPSIHPMFYIGTKAMNHTRDFTTAAGKDEAQPYTLNQAKALAMTAIDVLCNPELLDKIKADFAEDLKKDSS